MKDKMMGENKNSAGKKIITGMIFLASLFFAAVVLVGSVGTADTLPLVIVAGVVMLVAAFFFLSAIFEDKAEQWKNLYEEMEKETQGEDAYDQLKGYVESVDRTQKAVFSVMKRREESMEDQISRLESAIEQMAEQQAENHKAMVRYNKENARQMAINERETLEHAMSVIVKKMEEGKTKELEVLQSILEKGISVSEATPVSEQAEEFEETPDFLKEFGIEQDSSIEDFVAGLSEEGYAEEFFYPETEEPEEEPVEEDFIPELLLPETETVTAEPEDVSADALGAATGVDLSDPNAALSPEDIAKLFAAAGN